MSGYASADRLANPNPCFHPTTTPYPSDAFVAKINPLAPAGTQLLFSTYLGGTSTDSGTAVTVDSGAANVYLTGSTNSSDFIQPTVGAPYQLCLDTPPATPPVLTCPVITQPAPFDAFVARMSNPTPSTTGVPNFVTLNYFSYLGGAANDYGNAIAVDSTSDAHLSPEPPVQRISQSRRAHSSPSSGQALLQTHSLLISIRPPLPASLGRARMSLTTAATGWTAAPALRSILT